MNHERLISSSSNIVSNHCIFEHQTRLRVPLHRVEILFISRTTVLTGPCARCIEECCLPKIACKLKTACKLKVTRKSKKRDEQVHRIEFLSLVSIWTNQLFLNPCLGYLLRGCTITMRYFSPFVRLRTSRTFHLKIPSATFRHFDSTLPWSSILVFGALEVQNVCKIALRGVDCTCFFEDLFT